MAERLGPMKKRSNLNPGLCALSHFHASHLTPHAFYVPCALSPEPCAITHRLSPIIHNTFFLVFATLAYFGVRYGKAFGKSG